MGGQNNCTRGTFRCLQRLESGDEAPGCGAATLSLSQPGNTRSRLAQGPNPSSAAVWSWASHCASLRLVFLLEMSLDVAMW